MNSFEFWNDLDKIFQSVVSYQEKNIEFNKQFINPWVKLGNVFDKQDATKEIIAHKNATEIDPKNAQNWYELANTYVRSGNFEKSVQAYQRTVELGFETGELYKNLALALFMAGRHADSVSAFQKSLSLLESNEEKAIVWNHLGNVYRKQNDYEMALQAFLQADHLENKNTPFVAQGSASAGGPVLERQTNKVAFKEQDQANALQPVNEVVAVVGEMAAPEPVSSGVKDVLPTDEVAAPASEGSPTSEEEEIPASLEIALVEEPPPSGQISVDNLEVEAAVDDKENAIKDNQFVQMLEELEAEDDLETPMSTHSVEENNNGSGAEAQEEKETFQEPVITPSQPVKSSSIIAFMIENDEELDNKEHGEPLSQIDPAKEALNAEKEGSEDGVELLSTSKTPTEEQDEEKQEEEIVEGEEEPDNSDVVYSQYYATPSLSAYDEFPNDAPAASNLSESVVEEPPAFTSSQTQAEEIYTNADADSVTEFSINMDTKNAHVWNELGTVYFNAGSYDDAIAAFSKAIELDQKFAWPYSNLALSYVQKGRLAEAILLYQRSIELFTNEREQAVTWNRLGSLYRRLNDYENAIVAYQRADELDPDSTAAHQQSRFSLLGSKSVNQESGYTL